MNETTQQTIVQTLRERILSGELSPGQRLVEAPRSMTVRAKATTPSLNGICGRGTMCAMRK